MNESTYLSSPFVSAQRFMLTYLKQQNSINILWNVRGMLLFLFKSRLRPESAETTRESRN